jgi:hypothetical protein
MFPDVETMISSPKELTAILREAKRRLADELSDRSNRRMPRLR